ncbi:MAG: TlpA disulfide reductase family protein [Woeseiaceae bacterium]
MIRNGFLATLLLAVSLLTSAPVAADQTLELENYRGKVVLLDFWASWCVPCRRSFPWMNEMQQKYADAGLVIIAVNLDNDAAEAATFLKEYPAQFEIAYDTDKQLARSYNVQAMPTSYLLDRDGATIERHLGFKSAKTDEYEAAIVAALKGAAE